MGLRIFETDPEAAPKERKRFADDLVGRFRSGYSINGRPASLTEWRVTTGDPDVADAIVGLYGGDAPQTWDTKGEDTLEVFTKAEKVKILLDGPESIRQEMVLWGRAGAIRRCDGVEQTGDEAKGKPCECPASFTERKEAAKRGTGCQPSISIFFRLVDDETIGRFKFVSGSWSLVKDIVSVEKKLATINGPAYAWLGLEVVEFDAGGQRRKFTKPVIDILGPAA
ncbi:hypothetical protein GCM10010168_53100 [Actinoplanes ianthinogenes]|uniref:Uncharacterized protein n=1 Tax=Actinoplanes ianthinogenes TaxID=122358 RepID=A0ABN6C8F8_9ACTN|nr:hypothetical protein [Actinoplanes ianthinogenes]BCJ41692.1 hypothetical protein Aiant_23490 [Actinoplanes ianthinogenes]GGR28375.1 hypothetical protein GCM10010168_53100 [Actinoplanes ianthinogenes]